MKILLTIFVLFYFSQLQAATYFVSSLSGNDGRSSQEAQSIQTPWKSLSRVSEISSSLRAGDSILLKRGETFFGTMNVVVSGSPGNPIVFGAYGQGTLPELTGFVTLSGFQQKGSNVWETTVPGGLSYMNTLTVNGVAKACGRYPNATDANQGYLTYDSFNSNTSITDRKLISQPNWQGGQIVMRKTRWIIDRSDISSQLGTTINYNSSSGYGGATGYGYFIQNHLSTLDVEGEWYYKGGRLDIYSSISPDSKVRTGITETLMRIANQRNLTFENLRFSGATNSAFEITYSQNIRISNCEILFSGKNGVYVYGTDGLIVENTMVAYTGNNGLSLNISNGAILRNNQIKCTAIYAGMGDSNDQNYEGILISGDNNLIINNTIDSTGYIPLNFSGNNVIIKNNVITNFALVKDDGGGIYTSTGSNALQNSGRKITGNIILNGIGAPGGTANPDSRYANGIYMDNNSAFVEISENTVANCATYGVYLHDAHDIVVRQNTIYNNGTQLLMVADETAPRISVYNNTVTGNIMFAKQADQMLSEHITKDNDDISHFGTFDYNYYFHPLGSDIAISVSPNINGVYGYNNRMGLDSWKGLYGQDTNSIKTTHNIPAYTVSKVTGDNRFTNGTFDTNMGGLYIYSPIGNAVTSWDSSKLDGGTLKVSFSSTSNSPNFGSVIIGIGSVTAGRTYRLKFTVLGANNYKSISSYFRQSLSPYNDLSKREGCSITANRQEKELLFTAWASENNASVAFDVPEQTSPVYLDNVRLEQVEATLTNPDQYISFFYNTTTAAKTFLTSPGSDVYGNNYENNITIQPFQSVIILKNTSKGCLVAVPKPVITSNP